MNKDTLESVSEAIDLLKKLESETTIDKKNKFTEGVTPNAFPYGIWFRGESEHESPLWPSIFRNNHNSNSALNEPSLSNHIQTRIPDLYKMLNDFDKLCLAQHYKIPTRLLDWTESILIGLYYAVTSGGVKSKEKDGMLYVLNAYTLNKSSAMGIGKGKIHTPQDFGVLFRAFTSFTFSSQNWIDYIRSHTPSYDWERLKKDDKVFKEKFGHIDTSSGKQFEYFTSPIAVIPMRSNQRMIVQSSVFTLFGGSVCWNEENCEPKPIPERYKGSTVYFCFRIPKEKKEEIEKDLFSLGIHKGTLFPEMEHQYEYLTTLW